MMTTKRDQQAIFPQGFVDEAGGVARFLQRVGQGRAINSSNYENLDPFGDHVFDLGQLVGGVVIGELQIGFVA